MNLTEQNKMHMIYAVLGAVSALIFLVLFANISFGQTGGDAGNGDVNTRRAQLQLELIQLEQEIDIQRKIVDVKRQETVSLERDVAILDAQINESELSIRARTLTIKKLGSDIVGKEDTIEELSEKMIREKESLAQLIRKTREIDSFSLVEVILSGENLSDFFVDLDSFTSIKASLNESFVLIEQTKQVTSEQKNTLEEKQREETGLRTLQQLQQGRIEDKRGQRNKILSTSKGQEKLYRDILNTKERSAASIRSELFVLRGSAAIPFGRALDLANTASAKTGVRPALILAIISEETNLGENLGSGNWKSDMHPTRDRPVFEDITRRLGFNPDVMPVSKKPWYGWGGAMGPAQFIPSTWILFEDRVAELTGNNPPNPWNPVDAFMASAVLLQDNGASKGGYSNERLAALRYFAGWRNANKASYAFYGDDVMELAAKHQRQIDILQGN